MKNKGITLISLVITIIILIILSSVAIYLSLGNNGIFIKAKEAKEKTNKQEATDIINLKITTAQMNKYAEKQEMPTLQELADILYKDDEIQYVALETQVASKEKVTVGDKTSIFTKLNQYPYEFEINSSLQLASINGIKIATNNGNNRTYTVEKIGETVGKNEIDFNADLYDELYMEVVTVFSGTPICMTYTINTCALTNELKYYMIQGASTSGLHVTVYVNKTTIKLAGALVDHNDYASNTTLSVWGIKY